MQHVIAALAQNCPSYTDNLWLVDSTQSNAAAPEKPSNDPTWPGCASYARYAGSHRVMYTGFGLPPSGDGSGSAALSKFREQVTNILRDDLSNNAPT